MQMNRVQIQPGTSPPEFLPATALRGSVPMRCPAALADGCRCPSGAHPQTGARCAPPTDLHSGWLLDANRIRFDAAVETHNPSLQRRPRSSRSRQWHPSLPTWLGARA